MVGEPAGSGSVILYTRNGGTTWEPMLSPIAAVLNSVDMVDTDLIYAAGSGGTILATFDGSAGNDVKSDLRQILRDLGLDGSFGIE